MQIRQQIETSWKTIKLKTELQNDFKDTSEITLQKGRLFSVLFNF